MANKKDQPQPPAAAAAETKPRRSFESSTGGMVVIGPDAKPKEESTDGN